MHSKPLFLENSPTVICEQIVWLIKNSNLNFQLKETPFGLDISLKKRFVQKWPQNINNGSDFPQASVPHNFPHHVPPPQPSSNSQTYKTHQPSFSNFDHKTESQEKASVKDYTEMLE